MPFAKLTWPMLTATALAFVGVVGLSSPDYDDRTDARLERAYRAAEESGFPLRASDLLPSAFEHSQDFALTLKSMESAEARDERLARATKDFLSVPMGLKPAADYACVRPHVVMVSNGSSLPWFVGESDPDDPFANVVRFHELSLAMRAAKLLCRSAVVEAKFGRWDSAVRFLTSARKIGWLTAQGPTIVRALIAMGIDASVVSGCLDLLEQQDAPSNLGRRLAEGPLLDDPTVDASSCLRGEAYMGVAWCRNWQKYALRDPLESLLPSESGQTDPPKADSPLQRQGWPKSQVDRSRMALHLEGWTPVLATMARTPRDLEGLDLAGFALPEPLETDLNRTLGQVAEAIRKAQARRRCARAVCLSVDFKATQGRFPTGLSEIRTTDRDPFSSEPLRYQVQGTSVRVWSVGPDRKDQGGLRPTEVPPGRDRTAVDIVAVYPRPAKRASAPSPQGPP